MKHVSLVFIILIFVACSIPENLGLPSWEVTYQLKILNDQWEVEDLADGDSTLVMINDVLTFHEYFDDQTNLGDLTINEPEMKTTLISVGELNPDLDDFNGTQVDSIPAFDIIPVNKQFDEFEEFQVIHFAQGFFHLTIDNNTNVYLGDSPEKPLQAEIRNYLNDEIVLVEAYPQDIPPNGSSSLIIDIAGIELPNTISIKITGGSKGTDGESTVINTDLAMTISAEIQDIKASYAIAKIPEQTIDPIVGEENLDTEYPEIIGEFTLNGISTMEIYLNSHIPVMADFQIKAIHDDHCVELKLNDGSYPLLNFDPNSESVTINSEDCNLNEFLSVLPTKFEYTLYPTIGDSSDTFYEVHFDDSVITRIDFLSEINVAANCWIIPKDQNTHLPKNSIISTEDFDIDTFNSFIEGGFTIDYCNRTGASAGFDVLISDEEFMTFEQVMNPDMEKVSVLHVPQMECCMEDEMKTLTIVLTQDNLQPFVADSIFVVSKMQFFSDANEPLQNNVSMRGEVFVKLMVSNDLIED